MAKDVAMEATAATAAIEAAPTLAEKATAAVARLAEPAVTDIRVAGGTVSALSEYQLAETAEQLTKMDATLADAAPAIRNSNVEVYPEAENADCIFHMAQSTKPKLQPAVTKGLPPASLITRTHLQFSLKDTARLDNESMPIGLSLLKASYAKMPGGAEALELVNAKPVGYLGK